jgi:aspartate/methionine/tyrosine aminotransferase
LRFSALVDRIAGDGADAWRTHHEARRALDRGADVILLSVGDPDLDTPAPVLERAIACLRAGDTHYTAASGRDELRVAIAALHRARTGQAVGASNAIFFAGAQNALFAASLCIAGPGDEVIALEPLYPTYPATIEVSGARLVRAPAPAALGFRPDLDALAAAVTPRTRAILFATPNNPSGVILTDADLEAIGALAQRHSLWIVADEVYAGLAPGHRVPGLAARLPDRVITISSLSKSHAMTGWRAGWMVGPEALIAHTEALIMCMLFGLPGFIQEAAVTALTVASAAEARIRDYCAIRCKLLLTLLEGIPEIRCTVPDAGMFLLLDVRQTGLSGYQFMRELYRAERVSVLDGGAFGEGTRGFVRVCFATDETALREACLRIRRFVASLAAARPARGTGERRA